MNIIGLIVQLLIGAVIGWIAGAIMRDQRGLIGNIIVGIVGTAIGSYLATHVFHTNFGDLDVKTILLSVLGAMILLWVKKLIFGKK
ncbi:GlsB/YeaQ/YmgE family stress response membrane protein [Guggenheimella bovis]